MGLDAALDVAWFWPYLLLFALAAGESSAFVGFAVPGEAAVLAAGVLCDQGVLEWRLSGPAVISGAIVGDSIGYAIGLRFGDLAGVGWFSRAWSPIRRQRSARFFERHGGAAVFWGRFIGFLRPLVPFAAGASRMPYRVFFFFNVAGAVLWGSGTLWIGMLIGEAAEGLVHSFSRAAAVAVAAGVTSIALIQVRRRRALWTDRSMRSDDRASPLPIEDPSGFSEPTEPARPHVA